jgi:hypothetical protein
MLSIVLLWLSRRLYHKQWLRGKLLLSSVKLLWRKLLLSSEKLLWGKLLLSSSELLSWDESVILVRFGRIVSGQSNVCGGTLVITRHNIVDGHLFGSLKFDSRLDTLVGLSLLTIVWALKYDVIISAALDASTHVSWLHLLVTGWATLWLGLSAPPALSRIAVVWAL